MARLTINNLVKRFGDFTAIDNLSLDIADGEFITLLGPSGCGKTTTLRSIAGFIEPDEGDILFDQKRVNDIPPNKRSTAMVFQSYALFPHMTVKKNIAFGLKMKKVNKTEAEKRISEAIELVGLTGLEGRFPKELSGGQQQRVAVARALVMQPDILLFDEPLSNLDAKLREKMRVEIRELQRKLKITAIYVTHDQAEALVISDRVVIMNKGVIQQIGKPTDVYNRPNSAFVADFIGTANFIDGTVKEKLEADTWLLETEIGNIKTMTEYQLALGDQVLLSVRPEDLLMEKGSENTFQGVITTQTYMGNFVDYHVEVAGKSLRIQSNGKQLFEEGDSVQVHFRPEDCTIVEMKDVNQHETAHQ
ncbi:ABC transporter ATP-binding protein [Anoxynatronum buryatiense]|uniref:Iron(III) transport system ATP-binding protein n=1 Tax=Anoxynatronum buryatiense TaxID=489973 RepID=A0AA46AK50_9CLOT|nr:ABC transporter ATP-binding protein [Anoxynatronum buryatiense]SMP67350.1 iron(III) transport system ATP-binding protein [Anoxynatronum buryatiense]